MEVSVLSSRGVQSFPFSCRPSSSYNKHVLERSAGAAAAAVPTSVFFTPSSSSSFPLPIKLESSPSTSRPNYRSSIWGSTSVLCFSNSGTFSLLLLAPALFQKQLEKRSGFARAYKEPTNPVLKFLNRVQGALPIVGLVARLVNPEGGVGTDRIRFEEFCTRVGRNSNREATSAFYLFAERHGKPAKPPFVLIWCWAAALGAGLLRSDDLLMGASRLRVSYDIQYEVENFDLLMDEAIKKREKSGSKVPDVPMEARAEKALEAICKCCTGTTDVAEEDAPFLSAILKVVFPTADKEQIDLIVASRLVDPFSPNASQAEDSEILGEQEAEASQTLYVQEAGVSQKSSGQEAADEQPRSLVQEVSQ